MQDGVNFLPMSFVLSGLDYCFIPDMVGFVHLHDSMLIEAKTTYSNDG